MRTPQFPAPHKHIPPDLTIVGFLGCDGAGTTTHAKYASEHLRAKGLTTDKEWMRFNHRFSLPVLGLGRLLGKTRKYEFNEYTLRAHHFEESRLLTSAYKKTFLMDQYLMTKRKYRTLSNDTDVVVFDRFILDGLVDLVVSTKDISLIDSRIAEEIWKMVPPDAVIIGLKCDPEPIVARRPDVAPDPFLELRTKVYGLLFENDQIDVVDTSQPLEDAKQEIVHILEEKSEIP